jgi:TATA-box binding protein (TBP) (component of TFIID and TFIIIB)
VKAAVNIKNMKPAVSITKCKPAVNVNNVKPAFNIKKKVKLEALVYFYRKF